MARRGWSRLRDRQDDVREIVIKFLVLFLITLILEYVTYTNTHRAKCAS